MVESYPQLVEAVRTDALISKGLRRDPFGNSALMLRSGLMP